MRVHLNSDINPRAIATATVPFIYPEIKFCIVTQVDVSEWCIRKDVVCWWWGFKIERAPCRWSGISPHLPGSSMMSEVGVGFRTNDRVRSAQVSGGLITVQYYGITRPELQHTKPRSIFPVNPPFAHQSMYLGSWD